MSPCSSTFAAGESVYHPKYGFGTVHSLSRQARVEPLRLPAAAVTELTEDYYDIHLANGGTVLIPVDRAEGAGLRRLSGGIEAVKAGLRSPAQNLPGNYRERAAALRRRELAEPGGLVASVRDLMAQGRERVLSVSEKDWLDKSCERLSTEAAMVDQIPLFEARAVIVEVIRELRGPASVLAHVELPKE